MAPEANSAAASLLRVFISFKERPDGVRARALAEFLRQEYRGVIQSFVVSDEIAGAEDNADLIPNRIDVSDFLVVFATGAALESQWVQQEIGYAFAKARIAGLRIIPIHDRRDRSSISGLLNGRVTNIHSGFLLEGSNEADVWRRVGDYIMAEAQGPIDMEAHVGAFSFPDNARTHFGLTLNFSNSSLQLVRDATVYMIIPGGYEVRWENPTPFLKYRAGLPSPDFSNPTQTMGMLPEFHQMQPIPRFIEPLLEIAPPLNLRKLTCTWFTLTDLPPLGSATQGWAVWASGPRIDRVKFGVLVAAPLHVPNLYQFNMRVEDVMAAADRGQQMELLSRIAPNGRLTVMDAPPHVA